MTEVRIGGKLDISEITVKAHRGQVMRKMKAGSLPDVVAMAARFGLRCLFFRGHARWTKDTLARFI